MPEKESFVAAAVDSELVKTFKVPKTLNPKPLKLP